jgi:hypothetical protein
MRPLKMGPICCPATSVRNYHSKLRQIPKERRPHDKLDLVSFKKPPFPTTLPADCALCAGYKLHSRSSEAMNTRSTGRIYYKVNLHIIINVRASVTVLTVILFMVSEASEGLS